MSKTVSSPPLLPIIAAIFAVTSVGAGLSLSLPLLSMLFEQQQVSGPWIGISAAMAGLAAIVAGPFVTPLAVRFGVANMLLVFLLVAAASLIGLYLVNSLAATFPLRLIFHAAITGIIILSEFWINAAAPPDRRGLFLGLYTTMLSLGFVAGPLILRITGIQSAAPFVAGAVVILVAVIPISLAARQAPVLEHESGVTWWRFIYLSPLAMAAVFVFGVAESGLLALFPVYGLRIGYTPDLVATYLITMGIGNVLFQLPIGLLIDRASNLGLTILFAAVGFCGAIAVPLVATSPMMLYFVIFFWGGIIPGLYTLGLAELGTAHGGSNLAAANAAFIMVYSFGNLIGPPSIGKGMDIWNPDGAMWVIAAGFAALGLFALGCLLKTKLQQTR